VKVESGAIVDQATAGANAFAGVEYTFELKDTARPNLASLIPLSPADGSVDVDAVANIVFSFNEPVIPGTGNILIDSGDGMDVRYIAIIDTTQVRFSSTAVTVNPLGGFLSGLMYRVSLETDSIRDVAPLPNHFLGIAPGEFTFTVADTVMPALVHLQPPSGSVGVALTQVFTLTFSEPVFTGTGDIVFTPDLEGTPLVVPITSLSMSGEELTITLPSPLVSAKVAQLYAVTLPSGLILDASGNAFPGLSGSTYTFMVVDTVGPSVLSFSPVPGDAVLKTANIVIVFDQPVRAGAGNITLTPLGLRRRRAQSAPIVISSADSTQVQVVGAVVTINPTTDLLGSGASSEEFGVEIGPGAFEDDATPPNTWPQSSSVSVTSFKVLNAISNSSIVPGLSSSGALTNLMVSFVTATQIEEFDFIVITFPEPPAGTLAPAHGFTFAEGEMRYAPVDPVFQRFNVIGFPAQRQIIVQKSGGSAFMPGTKIVFVLFDVTLPNILGVTGFYEIAHLDKADGTVLHSDPFVPGTNISNDNPPAFTQAHYHFVLPETYIYEEATTVPPFVEVLAGQVLAVDPDTGDAGTIVYTVVAGNQESLFRLDTSTGALYTTQYLDYDLQVQEISFTLGARDDAPPFRGSTATVTVTITDVNDHTPTYEFADAAATNYYALLKETDAVNTLVTSPVATDGDSGSNAALTFSILSGNELGHFAADPLSGVVRIAAQLDVTVARAYALDLMVSDNAASAAARRQRSAFLLVDVYSDDQVMFMTVSMSKGIFDLNVADFERRLKLLICPEEACTPTVESTVAKGSSTVVGFYVVKDVDAFGTPIMYTNSNSSTISKKLEFLTSLEIETLLLDPAVQQQLAEGALGVEVDSVTPGNRAGTGDAKWYEFAGLYGMIFIPLAIAFCCCLPALVLCWRCCRQKHHLRFTSQEHVGLKGLGAAAIRKNTGFPMFGMPPTAETAFGQDPLSVLYDHDRKHFGQAFGNPLHDDSATPSTQQAWWDVNHELEEGFLPAAIVGMGINGMAPASHASGMQSVFDASAIDPTTGRMYFYNTETGERSWSPTPLQQDY